MVAILSEISLDNKSKMVEVLMEIYMHMHTSQQNTSLISHLRIPFNYYSFTLTSRISFKNFALNSVLDPVPLGISNSPPWRPHFKLFCWCKHILASTSKYVGKSLELGTFSEEERERENSVMIGFAHGAGMAQW